MSPASSSMGSSSQCKFWLTKKNRFCSNPTLTNSSSSSSPSLYCGNHTQRSNSQWIPCPIDSSHSVLEGNLESHMKRCPLLKQTQSLSTQPYYLKGINAGNHDHNIKISESSNTIVTSEMKRNAVYAMSVAQFNNLFNKIKSLHASICNDIPDSFKIPEACRGWTNSQVDKKIPFQEKHAMQQASILGNLEDFGVLPKSDLKQCDLILASGDENHVNSVVEFGAGRGYLTQLLADCYGINQVILVERKSYKLKADRSLRQKESLLLERLRIDIEDLNLNAVESLKGVSYLAIGKHLCGPATDMTLRCCIPEQHDQVSATKFEANCYLRGLAIATCCHHLCQWNHYINKRYMLELGITKEDFHAITWFTSWAVDADHGSKLSDDDCSSLLQLMEREKCVMDVDPSGVEDTVRNMKAMDRAILGFMCKDIIDAGRLMWLKEQGLESQLLNYVPFTISPENHLLIAAGNSKTKSSVALDH